MNYTILTGYILFFVFQFYWIQSCQIPFDDDEDGRDDNPFDGIGYHKLHVTKKIEVLRERKRSKKYIVPFLSHGDIKLELNIVYNYYHHVCNYVRLPNYTSKALNITTTATKTAKRDQ